MRAPDLSRVRKNIVVLLQDQCTIHRDPGTSNDTFDPATGSWSKGIPTLVYSGVCSIKAQSPYMQSVRDDGAVPGNRMRWTVRVPYDSPEPKIGDVVTLTAATDATLTNKRFVVMFVGGGTYSVTHAVECVRWDEGDLRDWMAP